MVINEVIYAENILMYYLAWFIHLENKLNEKFTPQLFA